MQFDTFVQSYSAAIKGFIDNGLASPELERQLDAYAQLLESLCLNAKGDRTRQLLFAVDTGADDTNENPAEGAMRVAEVVQRYLALHPHEQANLSVVLYNCDSSRLPLAVVDKLGSLNQDEEDARCQVVLRHRDPQQLARLYEEIVEVADGDGDTFVASETTRDWYFLDDYADWLGQQEEQIADLLAMSPMTASDGSMHLVAVVTEAKYIDATNLATKRRESHRQLRDTLRRVAGAVLETPARLDCAVWLARLSDLLVDGVMFPASATLDLPAWRRVVRDRLCTIELRGYFHVFVSGPVDASDCTARTRLPEADSTSCEAYQEVFGRDRVRELVLCYPRQGDPTRIRWDRGDDGRDGGSAPRGPNERGPEPRGPASARGQHGPRDEKSQGIFSESHEPDAQTEPDSAASGAGSSLLGLPAGTPPHMSSIMGMTPGGATHDQPAISSVSEDDRRWSYPGVARWVAVAPTRMSETSDDLAWLRQIEEATKIALHQFHLQAKLLRSVLTPNAALLKFQGSTHLTVDQVLRRRVEFLTTHGLSLIGVQPEPGVVSLSIARPRRDVVSLRMLWQRWTPDGRDGNQSVLIGVREDDGELLVLSPGEGHSPHTLIAGSTGSGKSVLMQNIMLSIVATNRPDQARITLVDPKQGVDYFAFEGLPHLDGGIIDQQEEALAQIQRLVDEMDARYVRMRQARATNLRQYNIRVEPGERLPMLWLIHDEFADWMLTEEYKQEVASAVQRLGIRARAAGIYLVFAAQRPEANVMPMQLRANLGNRLILRVDSEGTSDIALGEKGAERLLGKGHLLAKLEGTPSLVYAQVPFATPEEIDELVQLIRNNIE